MIRPTIRIWKDRDFVEDASHAAHRLQTTLSSAQEIVVVELRKLLLLSLDDLLVVTREFINPDVSSFRPGSLFTSSRRVTAERPKSQT
ncbi:MAG: hypothetical protein KUG81_04925 [Gammaproteobacteria bacterium]|nr:hypothetical protein [Gammaproteobacteria bacterium]